MGFDVGLFPLLGPCIYAGNETCAGTVGMATAATINESEERLRSEAEDRETKKYELLNLYLQRII